MKNSSQGHERNLKKTVKSPSAIKEDKKDKSARLCCGCGGKHAASV